MKRAPDPRLTAVSVATASGVPLPSDPAGRRRVVAANAERFFSLWGDPAPPTASEHFTVAVPGHPDAEARVLWPSGGRAAAGSELPVYLLFFGGGFQMGSIDDPVHAARGARIAHEAGCIVVLGSYSLAPEARFPTQPEQACALLDWVVSHAAELGGDPARVAVGGASAGANLAAAATIMRRDRGGSRVRAQILEFPATDLTTRSLDTSGISRTPGLLVRRILRSLHAAYADRRQLRSPLASPLFADLSDLPDALILTAEFDPLRGDGEEYAHALMRANVPTTCVRLIGQTHFGGGHSRFVPSAAFAHEAIVNELRRLHGPARRWPTADQVLRGDASD